jgi:tetratricopeptide (TPR) repeat protein
MGWNALPYAIVCGQLGYNLSVLGRVTEGRELFERGNAIDLEKVSNLTTKMAYCSWQGLFISLVGEDFLNASTKVDQLVELAERSDSPFMMLTFNVAKSNIMIGLENYTQARSSGQQALNAIEGKGIRTGHVANLFYNMAIAALKTDDLDKSREYFEEGRSLIELAPNWWEPRYSFLEGLIIMNEEKIDYHRIETCFKASIQGDENVGANVPAAQTRYYLAKNMMHRGDEKGSIDVFEKLHNSFQEWGISVWANKCKQELETYRF